MDKVNSRQDKLTLASICGVLFFGVPNQGMETETLVPMVGDHANRGFLESLRPHSELLRKQSEDFSRIIGSTLAKCSIVNFYETEKSPTARWNQVPQNSLFRG